MTAPSLADLERAVEEAVGRCDDAPDNYTAYKLNLAINAWLAARRAARDAGMVSVLLPPELFTPLEEWREYQAVIDAAPADKAGLEGEMEMAALKAWHVCRRLDDALKADEEG